MTLGRSAWVPNQYTTELGSTGSGAESQFRPPSLLRRIAPVTPGMKSPLPTNIVLGSSAFSATPRQ